MRPLDNLISIIIPSARPDSVHKTLQALLAQSCTHVNYEILVVTPAVSRIAHDNKQNFRVISVDRVYAPGKMRNRGAAVANGELLAFIDDDCVPDEDWLETLLAVISEYDDVAMVGCRVVAGRKGFWPECADHALFAAYQYTTQKDVDLGSAAVIVRRKAFEEVGGFDETLLASEDWDFSLRLRNAGWKCVFTPETEVLHFHGRESFRAIVENARNSGFRSGLTVQQRHYQHMSWLAKISVKMGTPTLYLFLIIPYAMALTMMQGLVFFQSQMRKYHFLPIIFLCRFQYQYGVWKRLLKDQSGNV